MQGAATSEAIGAPKPPFSEPEPEPNFQCPRCESANTKFCYYNNYNLSQPRHFCKDCRRYWTRGGALRNVPVGGGTRKNSKRSSNVSVATNFTNPAATVAASGGGISAKRPSPSSSSGDAQKHDLFPFPFPPVEDDHRLLDFSGSFSSLLSSTSHFGNFIDEVSTASASAAAGESFLGLPVDSGSWSGGLPDITIYTPGTNFQ